MDPLIDETDMWAINRIFMNLVRPLGLEISRSGLLYTLQKITIKKKIIWYLYYNISIANNKLNIIFNVSNNK